MKNKNLIILPGLLLLDFIMISVVSGLVRQPSDMAVIVGLLLAITSLYGNYFIIKYITKKPKTTK